MSSATSIPKNVSCFKRLFACCSTVVLLTVGTFSLLSTKLPVSAQQAGLGILPANPKDDQPETKSWFVKTLKPGEKVEDEFVVQNFYDTPKDVEIHVNDATQSASGGFDYKQNNEEKTGVAKWVKLAQTKVKVEAKMGAKVKFSLEVPKDTPPGEYAGVISVQSAPEDVGGNILTLQRTGVRLYITVPGNLEVNTKVNSFKFVSTNSDLYQESISRGNLSNLDKVTIQTNLQNLGNIYANISGSLEIQTPKGEKKNTNFNIDLAPKGNPVISTTMLPEKWQIGTYKATLKLVSTPQIPSNKENVKNENKIQEFSDEITITQEILDQIQKDISAGRREVKSSQGKIQAGGIIDTGELASSSSISSEQSIPTKDTNIEETAETNNTWLYIAVGGVVLAILLAVIIFILLNKKKNKKEEQNQKDQQTEVKKS